MKQHHHFIPSSKNSQNRSSSSTGTGLPNARCSSWILPSTFLLSFPVLARDLLRFRGSGSDVAKDEGECDIGGKGTVGATESAESGAELPPSSREPLRIESGDPLDCSACISVATLVAVAAVEVVVVVVMLSVAGNSFDLDLDLDGGGLLSSGTVEVRRKVVLWPWLSPRVSLVSLAGFVRVWGVRVASVKRDISENDPDNTKFKIGIWDVLKDVFKISHIWIKNLCENCLKDFIIPILNWVAWNRMFSAR